MENVNVLDEICWSCWVRKTRKQPFGELLIYTRDVSSAHTATELQTKTPMSCEKEHENWWFRVLSIKDRQRLGKQDIKRHIHHSQQFRDGRSCQIKCQSSIARWLEECRKLRLGAMHLIKCYLIFHSTSSKLRLHKMLNRSFQDYYHTLRSHTPLTFDCASKIRSSSSFGRATKCSFSFPTFIDKRCQ